MSWIGLLKSPLRINIEGNSIQNIKGEAADRPRTALEPFGAPAFAVAKAGIGMNPRAALCENILEDEKILGTVHVGFGDNSNMGGFSQAKVVKALVHGDGVVVSAPSIFADGRRIDRRGFFEKQENEVSLCPQAS